LELGFIWETSQSMRVLVTGGAGFIGSHMTDRLLKEGHEVVVIDNESTGRSNKVSPDLRYIKGDVTCPKQLQAAFADELGAVLHIAGHVSLIKSFSDPTLDLRTNIEGTLNVLRLCLERRVPRLLYASSMTVYGRSEALPTPEDTPCQPSSYYGISKYAAERYVHSTAERIDLTFSFQVTSFRMYNVYGPRQALDNPYQGVLGIFLGNVLRGEPLTIFGDGEQSRDFIYIDDVVDAWIGAIGNPASYGQVFNLGSGSRTSIKQLADKTLAAFDRNRTNYPVHYRPARPGEQRHVEADTRRARSILGWSPRTPFAAGLAMTVDWARQSGESDRVAATE
jgi:UDP-glucose 4-epimerase